jgi:hypothetical protein
MNSNSFECANKTIILRTKCKHYFFYDRIFKFLNFLIFVKFSLDAKIFVKKFFTKVCLNSKFPPTLHSTLEIQPATLFGEKCVRLYLLGYLSISIFTTQNFRINEKKENLF